MPFQQKVTAWMMYCFGEKISKDIAERNHRFLEESLELVQSLACTKSEAHQLVDYVFDRPVGEKEQECGGVMVTLAALCYANSIDMDRCGYVELERIWTKVETIREKQKNKPSHSPLPQEKESRIEKFINYIICVMVTCVTILVMLLTVHIITQGIK